MQHWDLYNEELDNFTRVPRKEGDWISEGLASLLLCHTCGGSIKIERFKRTNISTSKHLSDNAKTSPLWKISVT